VATCRQLSYLRPAIIIVTSFWLWGHWRHVHRHGRTYERTYGHLTAFTIYTVFRKNTPLCFLLYLLVKLTSVHKNWLYMFKNSPSICYIFFAIDDVIVTLVTTCTSMMGISTEDKYLIRSLRENKKYGAKWLLICFLTKTGVLVDWKRWSKNWKHRCCCSTYWVVVDFALSAQYVCCQFFFWSALSVHQDFSFC